jgi:hypothetical protein
MLAITLPPVPNVGSRPAVEQRKVVAAQEKLRVKILMRFAPDLPVRLNILVHTKQEQPTSNHDVPPLRFSKRFAVVSFRSITVTM